MLAITRCRPNPTASHDGIILSRSLTDLSFQVGATGDAQVAFLGLILVLCRVQKKNIQKDFAEVLTLMCCRAYKRKRPPKLGGCKASLVC